MYKFIKGIPNVVEFKMKEKIYDMFALKVFDILRNQESRFVKVHGTYRLTKANKYLDRQFRRLLKYARKGELEKFNFLARILLRKSKVYGFYAMKFVFPKLLRMNTVKAVNLWRRTKVLRLNESTELKYKRVWITDPGKAETFTRPLGVPTAEWRIYGHMLTKIMEVYFEGRGYLTKNQHGGKARFGVMSFLKSLAKELERAKCLLEFDIKGFFNNVSHESMLKLLEGCYLKEKMSTILKCKPESYQLPPKSEDRASKEYEKAQTGIQKGITRMGSSNYGRLGRVIGFKAQSEMEFNVMYRKDKGMYIPPIGSEMPNWEDTSVILNKDNWLEVIPREGLDKLYKDGMNTGINFTQVKIEPTTESQRAEGRDNWKGLGKDNCGVPQGTAFGPLLASTVLGRSLRHLKTLIYMDDGVLIAKSVSDAERLKGKLQSKLRSIGCEISPEKTNVLDGRALITAGVKLLGTRWTQAKSIFSYSVKSETRKGITRPFVKVQSYDLKELVDRMYEAGLMSFSKNQVFWREIGSKYVKNVFDDTLLGIAVRHEIFGSILAKAYSPESSIAEMVREIQYGVFKAEAKLAKYPWNTIEKKLYKSYQARYINEEKRTCTTRITLQNVSTLSNDIFLSYINKDLPVRSKLIYNFYPQKVRKAVVKRIVNSGLKLK